MHQKYRRSLPGLRLCSFDGWRTQVPWGTGEPEVCCRGADLQRCEKQQEDSGGLYCPFFSSSIVSDYTFSLCSGVAEGKVLTVLTFPRKHFWDLGSLCTYHPDSFLPLTYSSWQSICLASVQRMQCQVRMAGPKQRNDKEQQGIPCSSKQLCCRQKGGVHTPCPLSICIPVVSALAAKPLLCSMGRVSCSGGRLRCLDPELSLVQPISCWTVITFSHSILFVLFCSCCQMMAFSPFHFFSLSTNFPTLAICSFSS